MWSGQAVISVWLGYVWVWIKRGDIGNNIKKTYQIFGTNILFILYLWYQKNGIDMSREILYKKEVGGSVKIDVSPKQEVAKADSLVDWLKTHELINISALCREAGINRSNFDKSLKMGLISPKQEAVLSKILKKYGYV